MNQTHFYEHPSKPLTYKILVLRTEQNINISLFNGSFWNSVKDLQKFLKSSINFRHFPLKTNILDDRSSKHRGGKLVGALVNRDWCQYLVWLDLTLCSKLFIKLITVQVLSCCCTNWNGSCESALYNLVTSYLQIRATFKNHDILMTCIWNTISLVRSAIQQTSKNRKYILKTCQLTLKKSRLPKLDIQMNKIHIFFATFQKIQLK